MVRIGAPRDLELDVYEGDPANYKRDLGAYLSPRDLTQLFVKSIETPNIENEHGIPWQVVYGISNNTRAFWSLSNAREVLGYALRKTTRKLSTPTTSGRFCTGQEPRAAAAGLGLASRRKGQPQSVLGVGSAKRHLWQRAYLVS